MLNLPNILKEIIYKKKEEIIKNYEKYIFIETILMFIKDAANNKAVNDGGPSYFTECYIFLKE